MNVCLFCCSLYLVRVLMVLIMGDKCLVRVLCAKLCGCIVLWRYLGRWPAVVLCAALWWVCRCLV